MDDTKLALTVSNVVAADPMQPAPRHDADSDALALFSSEAASDRPLRRATDRGPQGVSLVAVHDIDAVPTVQATDADGALRLDVIRFRAISAQLAEQSARFAARCAAIDRRCERVAAALNALEARVGSVEQRLAPTRWGFVRRWAAGLGLFTFVVLLAAPRLLDQRAWIWDAPWSGSVVTASVGLPSTVLPWTILTLPSVGSSRAQADFRRNPQRFPLPGDAVDSLDKRRAPAGRPLE